MSPSLNCLARSLSRLLAHAHDHAHTPSPSGSLSHCLPSLFTHLLGMFERFSFNECLAKLTFHVIFVSLFRRRSSEKEVIVLYIRSCESHLFKNQLLKVPLGQGEALRLLQTANARQSVPWPGRSSAFGIWWKPASWWRMAGC